ncbi:MAG: hypothetical protein HYR91_13545 [Flavobacteriia bacterium]|nr:hypothetical protein [Flavobacteriia bacterium]
MNNKLLRISFFVFGIVSVMIMFGCRKKKDTIAIISVSNTGHQSIEGAKVVLYAKASDPSHQSAVTIHDTAYTNSSGQAYFNFNDVYQLGQAGVAVLNISASKDNLVGEGIIKIEEEKTSNEGVVIQ